MASIPATRDVVRAVWTNSAPDYAAVHDAEDAAAVLTGLLRAALKMLTYRRLAGTPSAISLVSGDADEYARYPAAGPRTADTAVLLSHAIAATAEAAAQHAELTGSEPPLRALRIVVRSSGAQSVVHRLDLDPESPGGASWYGPYDPELFAEVATGFALLVTHLVANVFDDDDGRETFEESLEWID
ncbi:hypothetical protein [Planctomonas psychrotolerans]|uniref:hypothetical protein n=1 Tax=Planctomonas psychrotolerans TaxID=2528712 RepID=UPI0012398C09|nr:hypothetical protein [Planctomonas psychrotolerans]